jgi:hypothetical protein
MASHPGHWYCHHCRRACELNQDREQNCCLACGNTNIEFLEDPASLNRETVKPLNHKPAAPSSDSTIPLLNESRITPARASLLFQKMRAQLE